jgi:integrase
MAIGNHTFSLRTNGMLLSQTGMIGLTSWTYLRLRVDPLRDPRCEVSIGGERELSDLVYDPKMEKEMLDLAEQPLRDIAITVFDAGMRPAEIVSVEWSHFLWDKNLIFVPGRCAEGHKSKEGRFGPTSNLPKTAYRVRAQVSTSKWAGVPLKTQEGRRHLPGRGKGLCRRDAASVLFAEASVAHCSADCSVKLAGRLLLKSGDGRFKRKTKSRGHSTLTLW